MNIIKSNTTGRPKYYANWDENTVIVAPTPDQAYNGTSKLYLETNWIIGYNC
jgi:hypothetical protein